MKKTLCILVLLLILPIVRPQTQLLKFRPNAESFTAEAGEDRTLECAYEGEYYTGSLSWSGPAVGSGRTAESGNGVTRSILTISAVHLSDAGTYVCSRHSDGPDEEVSAHLRVIDDPEFLDVPLEQSLISGTDAVVQCQAYLGHPAATLQWFKDNSPIAISPGSRFSVDSDGLHIQDVNMQDRGEYRCLLERQGWGVQLRDITVEVLPGSPCIDKTMNPVVEVLYNAPLMIDCTLLEGCAQADVWWVKPDGTIVREQTLHQEAPHSPGIYSCFAHNQNGNDRYDVVLDIRAPPLPPASEHDVLVSEGQTVELSVDLIEVTNPVPTYTWQSEDGASFPMEQEGQGEQRIYVTEEGTLVLPDVTVKDSGTYRCTVQNVHGTSVQSIKLQVEAIPPQPRAPLTLHINEDCENTEVTVLTQQMESELRTLCRCSDVIVTDVVLECQSASEGKYTATVLSQSENTESLVEELYEVLRKDEQYDFITACDPTCPTAGPARRKDMLVPVVVVLSVVCVVVVLGAVAAGIYCRHRTRPREAALEQGQEPSLPCSTNKLELQVSVVPAPCPFPHPSLQHYPAGPFHQQPLTPPQPHNYNPQPRLQGHLTRQLSRF